MPETPRYQVSLKGQTYIWGSRAVLGRRKGQNLIQSPSKCEFVSPRGSEIFQNYIE